jgi:hypothetical protein
MRRAESLFHDYVIPVTESLSRQLGYAPEYAALFITSIISHMVRNAAINGVLGDYGERAVRPGWSREATCPGFEVLEGKYLGQAPGECVTREY